MIFGITIVPSVLALGGVTTLSLVVFQILTGTRVIRFKGPTHTKVHRTMAYVVLAAGLTHGISGLAYVGFITL